MVMNQTGYPQNFERSGLCCSGSSNGAEQDNRVQVRTSLGERTGTVRQGRFPVETYRDAAVFRTTLRLFFRGAEDNARKEGLSPQQRQMLLAVRGHPSHPAVSMKELTEALQVREPSASTLVDRAVKKGHVLRVRSAADRRKVELSLTQVGQDLLDRVMEANRKELRHLHWGSVAYSMRRALAVPVP